MKRKKIIPSTRFALYQLLEEVLRVYHKELKKSSKSKSISKKVVKDAIAALAQGELRWLTPQ